MDANGRDDSPFSGRVWQEIDRTIASVRAANCTARRFLEVDGPYGLGLTSTAGEEGWLPPHEHGADYRRWNVMRPQGRDAGSAPSRVGGGTYLVRGNARPVPLIASEFLLGMRAIEAYEAGSQPLDIRRATRAARDLALEEERLIYYGCEDDPEALLSLVRVEDSETVQRNATVIDPNLDDAATVIDRLHDAIEELALRGYAGPFALTIEPHLYTQIYSPNPTRDTLHVHLLASLFRGGIYMAPVIDRSHPDDPHGPRGAVVTVGRAFASLVVGQDWVTSYRGRDGVLYRFLIVSSLQLQISDPLSIQVLTAR